MLDDQRRSSKRRAKDKPSLALSDLVVGLVAPLSLHRGALTPMLHHREVVTDGAAGGCPEDRMMADVVAADTADDGAGQASRVGGASAS